MPRAIIRSSDRFAGLAGRAALAAIVALVLAAAGCQVRRQAAPVGAGFLRVAQVTRATDRAVLSPVAWSPDGRRFAYGGRDGVWIHRLDESADTRIAPGQTVTDVAWSTSADVLAYVDAGTLWTIRPDGRDRRRIPVKGRVSEAVWAPGGDRLAVVAWRQADGGLTAQVWVTSPTGAFLRPVRWETGGRRIAALGWFPDSLHLFVGLASADGETTAEWWRVRIAYPDFRRLPGPPRSVLEYALSPTGEWIAFVAAEAGVEQAFVVRADGSGMHAISKPSRRVTGLAWSPHGDKLAYGLLVAEAQAEIFVTGLSGTGRLLVASYRLEFPDPAAALSVVWSPDESHLAYGTNTGVFTGPVWLARFQAR